MRLNRYLKDHNASFMPIKPVFKLTATGFQVLVLFYKVMGHKPWAINFTDF